MTKRIHRRPLALVGTLCLPSVVVAISGPPALPSWVKEATWEAKTHVDQIFHELDKKLDNYVPVLGGDMSDRHEDGASIKSDVEDGQFGDVGDIDQNDDDDDDESDTLDPSIDTSAEETPSDSPPLRSEFDEELQSWQNEAILDDESESLLQDKAERSASPSARPPIIYRYFGRRRDTRSSDAIPFIVLAPTVDSWRLAGEALAARGFSSIVCKRQLANENISNIFEEEDGSSLVLRILDAMRWKQAVLVGCDNEAVTAMDAALQVNPDRISGLVLCGDLEAAQEAVRRVAKPSKYNMRRNRRRFKECMRSPFLLDLFLRDNMQCPYAIIWSGNFRPPSAKQPSSIWLFKRNDQSVIDDRAHHHRTTVLGGGLAPHRRLPDQFAWILARFVEEKTTGAAPIIDASGDKKLVVVSKDNFGGEKTKLCLKYNPLAEGSALDCLLSSSGATVLGRKLATFILYIAIIRIGAQQYQNLKFGVQVVYTVLDFVEWGCRRVLSAILPFLPSDIPAQFSPWRHAIGDTNEGAGTQRPEARENEAVDMIDSFPREDNTGQGRHGDGGDDTISPPPDVVRFTLLRLSIPGSVVT